MSSVTATPTLILDFVNDRNYVFATLGNRASDTAIFKVSNGVVLRLARANVAAFDTSGWQRFAFTRKGSRFSLHKGTEKIIETTMTLPMTGTVGIGSRGATAKFRQIAIESPD